MPIVFISHSTRDSEFIERYIIPALKANHMEVWYSPQSIETSAEWEQSIKRGLETSDWFLVAISPNSVESRWVHAETSWAFDNREDRIIPAQIAECNPDDLHLLLRELQINKKCIKDPEKGAEEIAFVLAKKVALAEVPRTRATRHLHPFWKWSIAGIIFVLLAAVAVIVFKTRLWPTLRVPENQQTRSEPVPSSQGHDRAVSSSGGPPRGVRNPVSPPSPGVADVSLPMVPVRAGKFLMGSPTSEADRDPNELQHEVRVGAFWMDATEVTNAAFQRFLVANPSWRRGQAKSEFVDDGYLRDWKNTEYPATERGYYPVTRVSWYAAQAYCAWTKKRLPTEAEWEYAARAETTTAYWWGDKWDPTRAAGHSERGPYPVAKEAHRNQWNLFDMLGNVKEWTSSVYKPYPYDASDGREAPGSVSARSLRGGSWADDPEYLRSAARIMKAPNLTDGLVGFRCANDKAAN